MWLFWCLCMCGLLRGEGSVARDSFGSLALFTRGAEFSVESTALLNEAERQDREVGYKLRARLLIRAAAADRADPHHLLLHFTLKEPQLLLRGKHENAHFVPHGSIWNEHMHSEFYAVWKRGVIEKAYLNPADPLDVLNYKKSLISLFQIQNIDSEHNETDISGTCNVLYESPSLNVIRKIKRNCVWNEETDESEDDVLEEMRRVTRYSLSGVAAGALELSAVHAEELVRAAAPGGAAALKARAWHRLQREDSAPPAPAALPELAAALLALPRELAPLALPLDAPPEPSDETLDSAWEECQGSLLDSGAEAEAEAEAEAALRLSAAARAASTSQVRALLARAAEAGGALPALCRALGAAGGAGAHEAAEQFLQLRGDAHAALALEYLAALALSATPQAGVARAALKLATEARAPPLQHAALLAAAALAPRALPRVERPRLVRDAKEHIVRALAKCKDEGCRTVCLHALGNLGSGVADVADVADVVDLLLAHADNGTVREALAALDGLEAARGAGSRLERLERLALGGHPSLEVRAAALDLLARAAADSPRALDLAPALQQLQRRRAPETRALAWSRLEALQERCAHVREALARLEARERSWAARAGAGGASGAVRRAANWRGRGWAAHVDSAQVTAGALLRRARVRLLLGREPAACDYTQYFEALNVELWTEGMEALMGSESGEGGAPPNDDESPRGGGAEPRAGLGYSVGGVRVGGAELFRGQAQLLSHVWAGSAEAATPALRALLVRRARRSLPLLVGASLRAAGGGAAALALDAAAQVSLWSRTARAQLLLRASLAARASLALASPWARLAARGSERGATRLRVEADADFYDGVALCVRASTEDFVLHRNVSLSSSGGARGWRVGRERRSRQPAGAGRSLALGRRNDAACRALVAADPAH